jgi:sulfide:quinone oxidoreductase
MSSRTRVIVVGGGVAAAETCLALHALGGERAHVTLVAPNAYLGYRPIARTDPLGIGGHARVSLARLAAGAGADVLQDRLTGVDAAARRARTAAGHELAYDALVLAVGAAPRGVPVGAVPFDPRRITECRSVLCAVERGDHGSLAFVEPPAPTQELELYDLALETAVVARRQGVSPALTLVTAQAAPLAMAGARVSGMLQSALASHGIRVVTCAHLRAVADGDLDLVPPLHPVFAERVIAAPRLRGAAAGLVPCDADGFLPTDPEGRVRGADGIFAAGDCTAFPVKHPSIAAQQADAVAATIAGRPAPFEPVLRCLLPSRLHWYVEAPLTGGHGDASRISAHPLWPGHARFGARYLTPRLAELEYDDAGDCGDHDRVNGGHHTAAAVAAQ